MTATLRFQSIHDLRSHIGKKVPTLYFGSQSSTVIPFENDKFTELTLGDLSLLPRSLKLKDNFLEICGPVTWKEARDFVRAQGRELKCWPTEESAQCLSGIATSATGERSFGYGSIRDHVVKVEYLNSSGELLTLNSSDSFEKVAGLDDYTELKTYQDSYLPYAAFKNAPFPRFQKATDLMTGTEGQLGVISKALFQTTEYVDDVYLFLKLPPWTQDYRTHLEILNKVQSFRTKIEACELVDFSSLSHLPEDFMNIKGHDVVFLQVPKIHLDSVLEELIMKLESIPLEDVFQVEAAKCRAFRMSVPRHVFEKQTKSGLPKFGTDVQVKTEDFAKLLNIYKEFTKSKIDFALFGHFGDSHLHYYFLPQKEQIGDCKNLLEGLYKEVLKMKASPFAEHGIGYLKKNYIAPFYNNCQLNVFRSLKLKHDPEGIFFPEGFMNIYKTGV